MIFKIYASKIIIFTSLFFPTMMLAPQKESLIQVKGRFLVNANGTPYIFRGVNIPDPQHLNTKPQERPGVNAKNLFLKAIKEYKANLIRIPVLPDSDGYTGFFENPEQYLKNHLDPLIELSKELRVFVIVDLHYVADYLDKKENVLRFWEMVSQRYKNDLNVMFEIYNEPILPDDWNIWKEKIVTPVVELIRGIAKENIIIVTSTHYNSNLSGILENPVIGTNIVYSAHIYPNQFRNPNWRKTYHEVAQVYPLIITEWGYDKNSIDPVLRGTTSDFGKPLLKWMEEEKLSWTAYIFDSTWDPPMFNSNWELLGGENKMGKFIKEALEKNN